MKSTHFVFLILAIVTNSALAMDGISEKQQKALKLLKTMPSSEYGLRFLCVKDQKVVGTYQKGPWNEQPFIIRGTIDQFLINTARQLEEGEAYPIKSIDGESEIIIGIDIENGYYIQHNQITYFTVDGTIDGESADICVRENKCLLE